MPEFHSQIIFQEVPRTHRTEIPNVVFELLALGLISPADFTLYCVYRRIAGEHGACWVGTRGLAKRCQTRTASITESKKNLSKPMDFLNGKSLIQITPCNHKKQIADIVTIIDIWPENHRTFKKSLTCVDWEYGGVSIGSTEERTKEEGTKEESIRGPIVHNSPVRPLAAAPPPASPKETPAPHNPRENSMGSIPSCKEGFSINSSLGEIAEILELEPQYCTYMKPKTVSSWIVKHGPSLVLETLRFFFKVKSYQKIPIKNPEAWMEEAFKKRYADKYKHDQDNKAFAQKMKKDHNLNTLKINKRYCEDTQLEKDFYYNLPKETFRKSLLDLYGNRRE